MNKLYDYKLNPEWKNYGSKPITFDFAQDAMYFCILYPAVVMLLQIFDHNPYILLTPLLLFAGLIASTLIHRISNYLWILLLLQLLVAAAVIAAAQGLFSRILFGAVMAAVSVSNSVGYYHEQAEKNEGVWEHNTKYINLYIGLGTLMVGTFVSCITYMVILTQHSGMLTLIAMIAFYAFLTIYEIYQHNSGTTALMNSGYKSSDAVRLKRLNIIFAVGAAVLFAVLTGIVYILYFYTGLSKIDDAIIAFFEQSSQNASVVPPPLPKQNTVSSPILPGSAGSTGSASPLLNLISTDILYFFAAIIALTIAYMLFRLILNLLKIKRNSSEERKSVFSLKAAVKNIISIAAVPLFPRFFRGNNNNMKVRKTYHRFIKKQIKKGVSIEKSDAPFDIEQKVRQENNLTEATPIYEKARYSGQECSDKDVGAFEKHIGK